MSTTDTTPIKSVPKDCGVHYGLVGGKCHKCAYFNSDYYRSLLYKGAQYDGTPLWALIGEPVPEPGNTYLKRTTGKQKADR